VAAFKPRLPEPGTFSGPKGGKVTSLRQICQWLDGCVSNAKLASLPEAHQVAWAASFFRDEAATWWSEFKASHPDPTFDMLKLGMVRRFVGHNPFEMLCADLEGKTLSDFAKYESFKAWFMQTVSAMRSFAPADRMWNDTVLIDKLLLCLRNTLYYEGVVIDPLTQVRPSTLAAAIGLTDARHTVLLMRGQAHVVRPLTYSGAAKAGGAAAKAGATGGSRAGPATPKSSGVGNKRTRFNSPGAGPSGVGNAKGQKRARLPPADYLTEVHPHLSREVVQRHIDNSKRPGARLICPLCKGEHYITKCDRHRQRLARGKMQEN